MANVVVRPATRADIAAVTAIYRPAVLYGSASFEIVPPDEAEMLRRYETLVADGFPYLVAEAGGRIVGYAYAGPYKARPGYRFSVEDSVYVADGDQGKGVGRALLGELISICESKGFRQMIAVIGNSANFASIALHRSLGFVFAGIIHSVGFKHGRWLDSVIMQRALGKGDTEPPVER
ncbi:MAG TPA: GNAT family N-acetyltransferase [Hyphomicrobiaceae bacterium]|nr:GNAT family N-acetyltransferase [Hyphomicrobiaceae bacterium]